MDNPVNNPIDRTCPFKELVDSLIASKLVYYVRISLSWEHGGCLSIHNTDSVRCWEVVRFSEGPLSEVRL